MMGTAMSRVQGKFSTNSRNTCKRCHSSLAAANIDSVSEAERQLIEQTVVVNDARKKQSVASNATTLSCVSEQGDDVEEDSEEDSISSSGTEAMPDDIQFSWMIAGRRQGSVPTVSVWMARRNPFRWSGPFHNTNDLASDVLFECSKLSKAKAFHIRMEFSDRGQDFKEEIKCKLVEELEDMIELKLCAIRERRRVLTCREGDFFDVPGEFHVCRAWYGKEGYEAGQHGKDVTDVVCQLARKASRIQATNANFTDPARGKRKVLHIEYLQSRSSDD